MSEDRVGIDRMIGNDSDLLEVLFKRDVMTEDEYNESLNKNPKEKSILVKKYLQLFNERYTNNANL